MIRKDKREPGCRAKCMYNAIRAQKKVHLLDTKDIFKRRCGPEGRMMKDNRNAIV